MTDRDDMVQRIERALERYEKKRMIPKKIMVWSKMKQGYKRIPLQKPQHAVDLWRD